MNLAGSTSYLNYCGAIFPELLADGSMVAALAISRHLLFVVVSKREGDLSILDSRSHLAKPFPYL